MKRNSFSRFNLSIHPSVLIVLLMLAAGPGAFAQRNALRKAGETVNETSNTVDKVGVLLDKIKIVAKKAEDTNEQLKRTVASTGSLASSVYKTTREFNRNVKVIKGDTETTNGQKIDPEQTIANPKIVDDEFENLYWEQIAFVDNVLYPSAMIGLATYTGERTKVIEILNRPLGITIASPDSSLRIRYEIECADKRFFDKVSNTIVYNQPNERISITPEIPWNYDALTKNELSTPLSITYRIFGEGNQQMEVTKQITLRSVNDCVLSFKDMDLHDLFAAYINEEHPEIDPILREGINTGIVDGWRGYQEGEEMVHRQVAAIWQALHNRGIKYSDISTNTENSSELMSQAVRTIDKSLRTNQANCVDGSVLFASILRRIGIKTHLVLIPGHAYLAYQPSEKNEKQLAYVETTLLGSRSLITNGTDNIMNDFKLILSLANTNHDNAVKNFKNDKKSILRISVDKSRSRVKPIPMY